MLSLRLTLAIKKNLQLQNEEHHSNTSPAAVTAHTDYETIMILFILDQSLVQGTQKLIKRTVPCSLKGEKLDVGFITVC